MNRSMSSLVAMGAAAILMTDGSCDRASSPTDVLAAAAADAIPVSASADPGFPFRKILCFGDSITYGVTLEAPELPIGSQASLELVEGYVPKLWRQLESRYGPGLELVNAGLPGEGSRAAVGRIGRELRAQAPDLVLLLEGIIDVDNDSPDFPAVRDNLREIVRIVRSQHAALVLGTYPLLNPDGFRATNPENVPKLNDLIRRLAREESLVLADHERAVDLGGVGADGLHPNEIGYEVMADTWLAAIELLADATNGI